MKLCRFIQNLKLNKLPIAEVWIRVVKRDVIFYLNLFEFRPFTMEFCCLFLICFFFPLNT